MASEGADLSRPDNSFHKRWTATEKARSPLGLRDNQQQNLLVIKTVLKTVIQLL